MVDLFHFVVLAVLIILLPLITDLLNSLFPDAKIGRIAQKIVGYILVFFIASLVFVGVYMWYSIYFPYYLVNYQLDESSIWFHLNCFICFVLVGNILIYYYYAITTTSYLKINNNNNKSEEIKTSIATTTTSTNNNNSIDNNQCNQCKATKREKSYHCKICKRCTDRMDHHCPFISNCVGSRNHHHFLNFLFYTLMGCLYAMRLSWIPFRECIVEQMTGGPCEQLGKHNYIFVCTILVIIPITCILLWQLYVVYTDTMTVEILKQFKKLSFKQWIPYLWRNLKKKSSLSNFKRIFKGWKLYNLFVPFI